jgi:putative ABC transport system permease protein
MASMFNFDLTELRVPPHAILLQAVTGLVTPVLASLPPFLTNLRIVPAQAMSAYQMGRGRFGAGFLARLLSGANLWFARGVLMRPVILSVRNTFRSKGRLALTMVTLTSASAIFVSVFSVRASLFRTVDDLLASWNFDAIITFARPYRVVRIEGQALSMPGVLEVDTWIQVPGRRVRVDGSESGPIYLFAPHADSTLSTAPTMVEGRWLLPEDDHAIVVNTNLVREEPDIALGDEITLKVVGKERPWRVVGISKGVLVPMAYGNYPYVARRTGRAGRADAALLVTECHDRACVSKAAAELETHFERNGLRVSNVQTVAAERAEAQVTYGIVVALMLVMACMLAVVGGLGLMGTMSINVLERRREIGVLRAVGAPNRGVERVFILESVTIGLLSWLLGGVLALPMGKLLSDAVGIPLSGAPLSFSYSMTGLGLWLTAVLVLSVLASSLPARNASRLTVREVLAYE